MYRFLSNKADSVRFVLRALRYRNYRLFFIGQSISLTGSWMQVVTVSWLAYRLTNSAFLLGLIGFTSQIPVFILAPFGGVLADRWNRKNIVIVTQILAMIQALVLAFLSFTGTIAVWHIIALSIFIGLVNAFDMPVRQALVVDMVENKKDLGNAIALNSLIFNGARLIGSSLAGIIIAIVGEGMCFLINGVSFIAVVFALLAMRIRPIKRKEGAGNVLQEFKEGFTYAFRSIAIRHILLLIMLISTMGMSYAVLMPVMARDILLGGAHTLGFLMGAAGLGALVGALYLASKRNIEGLTRAISRGSVIFGVCVIIFSFSRNVHLSLLLMLCIGFGLMIQTVSSNTLLQNITDDDKRGRVMALYAIAFIGMMPFGSLLAGGLASRFGAPSTLLISGLFCITGSLFFAARLPVIREAVLKKL